MGLRQKEAAVAIFNFLLDKLRAFGLYWVPNLAHFREIFYDCLYLFLRAAILFLQYLCGLYKNTHVIIIFVQCSHTCVVDDVAVDWFVPGAEHNAFSREQSANTGVNCESWRSERGGGQLLVNESSALSCAKECFIRLEHKKNNVHYCCCRHYEIRNAIWCRRRRGRRVCDMDWCMPMRFDYE
jgi:hypothetical protein